MSQNISEQPAPKPQSRDEKLAELKVDVEAMNYDKSVSFEENMDRRLRFYAEKVEEILKKDSKLGQVGQDEINAMVTRQSEALRQIYLAKLHEFKGLMADKRQSRAKDIFESAETDAAKYFNQLNVIAVKMMGDKPLEAEDAAHLKAVLEGVSQMQKDPETIKIFDKITNQQPLEDEDYKQVVSLINPTEINEKNKEVQNAAKSFEASQVGTILSLMKPAERAKTLEYIAKLKPQDSVKIIEALTAASVVSVTQVQDLLDKNLLPLDKKAELQTEIQNGNLAKMRQIADEKAKERNKQFNKNYAKNAMSAIVGRPLLDMVGVVWMGSIAAANTFADFDLGPWRRGENGITLAGNLAKIAGNMATNPWLIGSSAAAYFAAKDLAPHLGGMFPEVGAAGKKIVEGAKDAFGRPNLTPEQQKEYDHQNSHLLWRSIRNNLAFQNFLMEGPKGQTGFDLLTKIRDEKQKARESQKEQPNEEKTSPLVTHNDVLNDKTISPRQKELLFQALNANINPMYFDSEMNVTLAASNQLNLHDGEEFKTTFQIIKKQEEGTP